MFEEKDRARAREDVLVLDPSSCLYTDDCARCCLSVAALGVADGDARAAVVEAPAPRTTGATRPARAGRAERRRGGTSWCSVAADAARAAARRTRGSSHARPVARVTHRVRDLRRFARLQARRRARPLAACARRARRRGARGGAAAARGAVEGASFARKDVSRVVTSGRPASLHLHNEQPYNRQGGRGRCVLCAKDLTRTLLCGRRSRLWRAVASWKWQVAELVEADLKKRQARRAWCRRGATLCRMERSNGTKRERLLSLARERERPRSAVVVVAGACLASSSLPRWLSGVADERRSAVGGEGVAPASRSSTSPTSTAPSRWRSMRHARGGMWPRLRRRHPSLLSSVIIQNWLYHRSGQDERIATDISRFR